MSMSIESEIVVSKILKHIDTMVWQFLAHQVIEANVPLNVQKNNLLTF